MKSIALGELAEINPAGPKAGELRSNELCCFVPMAALGEDGRLSSVERRPYSELARGYTPFKSNDVLLAKITPCYENNKIGLATVNGRFAFGSTEFHVIRCKQDKLEPRYLVHFLRQDRIRFLGERRMTGSGGQRRVPRIFLEHLQIPAPSLSDQQRVAAILDKADRIRHKRERAVAMNGELIVSVFFQMFGDSAAKRLGWKVLPLSELVERVTVGHVGPSANGIQADGIPFLRTQNIGNGEILTTDIKFIAPEFARSLRKSELHTGDIVISRHITDKVRSAIVPPELDGSNCANIIVVRPGRQIPSSFVQTLLQTPRAQHVLLGRQTGSAQKVINTKAFQSWHVPQPDGSTLDKFDRFWGSQRSLHKALQADAKASKELFDSISQRAFRGEL